MKFNSATFLAGALEPGDGPHRTRADLMSDAAVYIRTTRGQRALLRAPDPSATPALRILARVNGYTNLRRLIDLSPGDLRHLPEAIGELFGDGLIELVDPPM